MKTAFAAVIALLFFAGHGAGAQVQTQAAPAQRTQPAPQQQPPAAADLNAVLLQVQQVTSSTSVNIGRLRIEKWKTDSEQKQQLQQVAESLQKNIATAVPGMVTDVQSSRGSVVTSFKLYHNLNVLYENLNYLADVAGSLGKKEEFEPLSADCAALESARKNLSIYIEQAAVRLESANRALTNSATQARQAPGTPVTGKKVIVEDDQPAKKPAKPTKKRTSPPPASSAASPVQSAGSPH
ncbi:MAG: hypothetical protein LAO78_24460 [Acidobacteriia bacterium]|nr:hypothetical protein [Terriglobia bacterium]